MDHPIPGPGDPDLMDQLGVCQAYGPGLTLNAWTHVVGTYDGTTYTANAFRPTVIAAYQAGAGSYQVFLPGLIDDVAVYNRLLSATEVQVHDDSGRH
jgi:hypothetical protein